MKQNTNPHKPHSVDEKWRPVAMELTGPADGRRPWRRSYRGIC